MQLHCVVCELLLPLGRSVLDAWCPLVLRDVEWCGLSGAGLIAQGFHEVVCSCQEGRRQEGWF